MTGPFCHCFVDEAVEKALLTSAKIQEDENTEKRRTYVFIDDLEQQSQDRKVLRDQLFNVLLAGRDNNWVLLVLDVQTSLPASTCAQKFSAARWKTSAAWELIRATH
ncbi:Cytochrome P450 52A1 [Cytospora mali]|uniref:Cytochrome P450 52A1 n=1 Tax=Cytospora mali TaxID=578113 RepID=A0A194VWG2_CYTMA|nr:Cytochrome P450 52A1 [Valsa mali]